MAGRGPIPKPGYLRQRTNKTPGASTLPTAESTAGNVVPSLPDRDRLEDGSFPLWHPHVVAWWGSVWRSPMASEYLTSDMRGGLYQLALLYQDFWTADTPAKRVSVSAEIRLQEVRFGLSPVDRARLRWSIDAGETAAERTEARRDRKAPKKERDHRSILRALD